MGEGIHALDARCCTDNKAQVFVSGCFDLLHPAHIELLYRASRMGDLHVSIGNDETIRLLKGRYPVYNQAERLYMIKSLRWVKSATIASDVGVLDFLDDLKIYRPDLFIVTADGDNPAKKKAVESLGIKYLVIDRVVCGELPVRSSTTIKQEIEIPYRVELAGGWLDNNLVNEFTDGNVLVASLEPTYNFISRGGMAGGTREIIHNLWGSRFPLLDEEKLAKFVYACENFPGEPFKSGSQDAIGILTHGLNILHYAKDALWPNRITPIDDMEVCDWLEHHVFLWELWPRPAGYKVIDNININHRYATKLKVAADKVIHAICQKDLCGLGHAMTEHLESQLAIFPNMWNEKIQAMADKIICKGMKISGAGGGGYLILVCEEKPEGAINIKIRHKGLIKWIMP